LYIFINLLYIISICFPSAGKFK